MKMRYKNIVISGEIGTGKTTLAYNLARELGWEALSGGQFIRKWHEEHSLPLNDTMKIPEEVDREMDMSFKKRMKEDKGVIFESHLAGWLAKDFPETLKVLCIADFEVMMERVAERQGVSVEEARQEYSKRPMDLYKKFKRLYGVENNFDRRYFDLIIDTTNLTKEEVVEKVLEKLKGN